MNTIISVVTAVYNDEKYIKKTVESILGQTFTDFEYIIVNDGSTDNTLNILNKIVESDQRVVVVTQENSGPASARNRAINLAKGTFIALQDSDDISSPFRLEMQLKQLLQLPPNSISCTSYKMIDANGEVFTTNNKVYENINSNILRGSFCVCHSSIMISRELLLKVNCYNPFYKKSEDYDMIYRLLEINCHFEKINECLYSYRLRDNSEGSTNNAPYMRRVFENHLNRINNKPENFEAIISDNRQEKNFLIRRKARELFFSENYLGYAKFYFENFKKLPIKNYLLYFFYANLPRSIKKFMKLIF